MVLRAFNVPVKLSTIRISATSNALHQWSKKWLLSLNSSKCHVVSYDRTIDRHIHSVYYYGQKSTGNSTVARLDKIKGIGVYFDAKRPYARKNKQGIYRLN